MPERRGRSGRACRAVSAVALLLAACAPSGTDAGAGTGDAPRTVTGAIDLSIGALDGDDAYVFGRISGLALHPDGRILVADAQSDQVRVQVTHKARQEPDARASPGGFHMDEHVG